jgi:Amt family ammonium transporter
MILLLIALATATPTFAQQAEPNLEVNPVNIFPVALMLLFPVGLILLMSSAMPEAQAPATAINLLLTWSVAVLAYFAVGFAFHFGGVAQVTASPDLNALYWEWSPLDQSIDIKVALLWGVVGLQGWALVITERTPEALSIVKTTPGIFQLFASHIPLVGLAAMIPAGALFQRGRGGIAILTGLLMGAILYPLAGNWVWGGGWLFHLGTNLDLGHGLVDFGGASVIFLSGSLVTLVALLAFRPSPDEDKPVAPEEVVVTVATDSYLTVYDETSEPVEEVLPVTPMPSAYLPILGVMGAGLILLGWLGLATGGHSPTAVNFSPAQATVNGLLAALSAALMAAGYSWLTTRQVNPLMTSRGLVTGLVVAVAGAPFMPTWLLVVAGLVMGFLLPLLIYLFNQGLRLADELGALATYGVSAIISLLLVSLFADGQAGQGWHGIGLTAYHGIPSQGVSGLVVAPGFASDWPGQLQAQLLGMGAITVLVLGLSFLFLQTIKVVQNSWARTGLELTTPSFTSPASSRKSNPLTPPLPKERVEAKPQSSEETGMSS